MTNSGHNLAFMAPRAHWEHVLQPSKNEVRLAVDLYNRSGDARQLEAFIVHMSLGWLKLRAWAKQPPQRRTALPDHHRPRRMGLDRAHASNAPFSERVATFTDLRLAAAVDRLTPISSTRHPLLPP